MFYTPDIKLHNHLKQLAGWFVFSVFLIAALVLIGWQFSIDFLIHFFPQLVAMNPVTAVAFASFAISFFFLYKKNTSVLRKRAGYFFALSVILPGAVRLVDYIFNFNSGVDSILYSGKIIAESPDLLHGRMSPLTAICFIMAGVSLFVLHVETEKKHMLSHFLALLIALIGMAALIAYIYVTSSFHGNLTYVMMALHTSICFILIAGAILLVNPEKGLMTEITKPLAGSILARQLLPIVIFLPVLFGLFRLYLNLKGIVSVDLGMSLLILSVIVALIALVFYNTLILNKRDVKIYLAEQEMQNANYFLDTVLENIPNMIFVKDANDLRFVRFNKAGEELLGYSRKDLIGKNDYDFFPKEQADFFTYKDNEVIKSGKLMDITEEPIYTKIGERWLHTKKIPIKDPNGVPLYLVGISEDITERRKNNEEILRLNAELERKVEERTTAMIRTEKRFQMLIENIHDSISLVDEKFAPVYRSPTTELLTGWTKEERDARSGLELVHPEDEEKVKRAREEVLATSGVVVPLTLRVLHKAGHYLWMEGYLINMLHDEYVRGVIVNFQDITERKRSEEEIKKLTDELRVLLEHVQTSREEERKYIAREIHDELGQRLTALKIDVTMMQRKLIAEDISKDYILEELKSIQYQVEANIKAVKKIATDLRPEILDHLDLVEAVKWQVQQFENITGVVCEAMHLEDNLNVGAKVSVAVYRIVQEALTNIARHAQATSVSILMKLNSGKLLVEVRDNGKGIQVNELESMKSLGLIGMRERVHLLNGSLTITGEPGNGTTVLVEIPIIQAVNQPII